MQYSDKFWHDNSRYGAIHYSENNILNKQKSVCLLIFVHGVLGDATSTWGEMPEWVLKNADLDMDVISFSYPSQIWHRTSVSQASHDLKTWIETEFSDYEHYIFVTHSTGGLIVKHLLNQDYKSETESSLWQKTRQIINIAVPHLGGAPFLSNSIFVIYKLIYLASGPFLHLSRFASQGKKDWGKNQIIPGLRWKNRELLELDSQFIAYLKKSLDQPIPTPEVVDICAESDQTVGEVEKNQTRQQIHIRGTHESVKIPRRSTAPIVGIVAKIVSHFPQDISLSVVNRTLLRINEVNHAANFSELIGRSKENLPKQAIDTAGSQHSVCEWVIDRINTINDRPSRIVVSGSGGVGKSTVLRMLAWHLGCQYLAKPKSAPIPLLIPLQQITVSSLDDQTYTWERLWGWWLRWAQSLFPNDNCSMEWLEEKFNHHPVTIILDGLDDFLVNHSDVSLSTIVNLLRMAVHNYSENHHLSIVIAVRNDIYGLDRLADDPLATYEILPLSKQQAIDSFPACKLWLNHLNNPHLLEKILTPLVLKNYQPSSTQLSMLGEMTQASILNQIIETFLRNSRLVGRYLKESEFIEIEHLFIALSLISWLFFYKSRGEIHQNELSSEATQLKEKWLQAFEKNGRSKEITNFITACEIIESSELCALLLNSEVFLSTGPEKYRFNHRSWQELLLGRFFLNCLQYQYFDDIGIAKLYAGIYRMAGEMYQGHAISVNQVQGVIDTWKQTGSTCVTGNFIGFLSWTITPIDAQAMQLIWDELVNFKGLSRTILIGGLGYRILVNNSKDRSISDIRRTSFPQFIHYANPANFSFFAPVVSSLAWCYQKAFTQSFEISKPSIPWPELSFTDEITIKIVSMVSTVNKGKAVLTEESKSLQQALLNSILDTYQYPEYIIRAVHYLYILVLAEKHQVHAFAVSQELPSLLSLGSNFESLVNRFKLVPELSNLYRSCQQMHNTLESMPIEYKK